MTKKTIALVFVIFNSIYTVICIARFIYTGSQVIIDFNKVPSVILAQNSLWYIIPQLLYVTIFVGLLWLLKIYNEKFWIQLSVIMFITSKIATLILIHFNNSQYLLNHAFLYDVVNIGNFVTLLYLLVALFLVRSKEVRWYFRWFVILMLLSILLPRLGEALYDDFSISWALINGDVLSELCFAFTLILFIKVFLLSLRNAPATINYI